MQAYTDTCPTCIKNLPRKINTAGHQPILTKGFGARGQVDLIDFQACPDGPYKFLLNYQDHGIKFYANACLQHKTVDAVALALLEIFSTIGPPLLLQADNGREFSHIAGKGKRYEAKMVSVDVSDMVRSFPS